MESILQLLRRRLKGVGREHWAAMADDLNAVHEWSETKDRLTFHSLRKIAHGDRTNPGLRDVQAILDYFAEHDAGKRKYPWETPKRRKTDRVDA